MVSLKDKITETAALITKPSAATYTVSEILQNAKEFNLQADGYQNLKLLMALCSKYGIKPYRYPRQKVTTVTVKINKGFLDRVLWKEYLDYSVLLDRLFDEITADLYKKISKPVCAS